LSINSYRPVWGEPKVETQHKADPGKPVTEGEARVRLSDVVHCALNSPEYRGGDRSTAPKLDTSGREAEYRRRLLEFREMFRAQQAASLKDAFIASQAGAGAGADGAEGFRARVALDGKPSVPNTAARDAEIARMAEPDYYDKAKVAAGDKPTNPKDAISGMKVPLHIVPPSAIMGAAIGLLHGALKYGRMNWRKAGVRATVYTDATMRHLMDWLDGNDTDEDGCDNLFAMMANLSILIDARAAGKLNDDRNVRGGDFTAFKHAMEGQVARLKAMHAGKNPHHYTIKDNADA
jgi:hypothetical protein